jgi:hypothetical protein
MMSKSRPLAHPEVGNYELSLDKGAVLNISCTFAVLILEAAQ